MSAVPNPENPLQPFEPDFDERICTHLVARGRLKEADLARARRLHEESADGRLVPLLTRLGLVSEREMADALSEVLGLPLLTAKEFPDVPPANVQMSIRFLKQYHVVPIAESDRAVTVVVSDPSDPYPLQALQLATGKPVDVKIGFSSEIDDAIERYYGSGRSAMGTIVENLSDEASRSEDDIEHLRDLASEAPVIRLVNLVIQRAVEQRASDIHIEPFENRLKVRYRIDGVLQEVESPPAASTAAVISRVKIMAKLNIAERRLPQDGRIMLRVQGKELDLRVSTVPTSFGESVVMRILDRESIVFDFHTLGFTDQFLSQFVKVLELPHGILLVTGPTGSGKTTTLYTALSKLNTPDVKIITVEDPVEYQLAGINQVQVNESIGFTFASALRSILRQAPNVIMLGEIRDLETATIAINASLTGHLVFSTLHTNDAPSAVTRLIDIGAKPFLVASSTRALMAQRLVRKICRRCGAPYTPSETELRSLNIDPNNLQNASFRKGKGCNECSKTGYRGRFGIFEIFVIDDEARKLIYDKVPSSVLRTRAREMGMRTLREDGARKVLAGLTSPDEVIRATVGDLD